MEWEGDVNLLEWKCINTTQGKVLPGFSYHTKSLCIICQYVQRMAGFAAHLVLAPSALSISWNWALTEISLVCLKVALAVESKVGCIFIPSPFNHIFSPSLVFQGYSQLFLSFSVSQLIKQVLISLDIWGEKWIMWATQVFSKRLNQCEPIYGGVFPSVPIPNSRGHCWLFLSFRKQQQCDVW
jgi:hypothetical protein